MSLLWQKVHIDNFLENIILSLGKTGAPEHHVFTILQNDGIRGGGDQYIQEQIYIVYLRKVKKSFPESSQ